MCDEVLEELRRDVFVGRRRARASSSAIDEHRRAVERHPRGAVGLFAAAAAGQRLRAIEDADVVEAEKAAGEEMLARRRPCD